ncbi:hypothetical protein Isop_1363 [Isosphaera pallida ATCC 43644]|uniref:DUF997 domain-containing protein n=1 Tax=Isosphaera pallida (strain ATCC 43644 / DSM 9630 / IS1B) TaxID=575540 RepID=E8QXA7_ISOPI|nr:hypothetical protein [Isosphaera pallida]ADV61948.1 hypothetical protein Isop_1363 [Isosphaera pallida ATCC 43644]
MSCSDPFATLNSPHASPLHPSHPHASDDHTDPTVRHATREAIGIGLIWLGALVWTSTISYLFGYVDRSTIERQPPEFHLILGMPFWVVWGVMLPWILCAGISTWFALRVMADDDLGTDHAEELEADITGADR